MAGEAANGSERSWVDLELEDSFDEELEMELDDDRIARELRNITDFRQKSTLGAADLFP